MKLFLRTMLITWAVMSFIAMLALSLGSVLAPIREHVIPLQTLETCSKQAIPRDTSRGTSSLQPEIQCPAGRLVALGSEEHDMTGRALTAAEKHMVRGAAEGGLVLDINRDRNEVAIRVGADPQHGYVYLTSLNIAQPYFLFRHLATFSPIFIAGFLSLFVAAFIVRPLTGLNIAAEKFGSGNLKVRVQSPLATRKDELGDLARTFNGMAERIELLVSRYKDFLAHASHELGSPLTRLNIALALARRKGGHDLEQEHDRISQESVRLNSLVQEMLLLARLESGNEVNQEFSSFDVRDVVDEAYQNASFEAHQLDKVVTINMVEGFVVSGYPILLHRALDNVLRNAIRFAEKRVSIEVSCSHAEHLGFIAISDDGPGIATGQEEVIFEPFLTLSGSGSSGIGGGSGLGLAIARQAILANGGTIAAKRSPRRGLIVEIELPADCSKLD